MHRGSAYHLIQKTGYRDEDRSERRVTVSRVWNDVTISFAYSNEQGTTLGGFGITVTAQEAKDLATALTFYAERLDEIVR